MGKILKRCSICKRYGASYRVDDPQFGVLELCLRCWNNRNGIEPHPPQRSKAQDRSRTPKKRR